MRLFAFFLFPLPFPAVRLVDFLYELPRSPKDYIHRIGRTGRAGVSGRAISLICPEDQHHFGIIQKKMGKKSRDSGK